MGYGTGGVQTVDIAVGAGDENIAIAGDPDSKQTAAANAICEIRQSALCGQVPAGDVAALAVIKTVFWSDARSIQSVRPAASFATKLPVESNVVMPLPPTLLTSACPALLKTMDSLTLVPAQFALIRFPLESNWDTLLALNPVT